MSNDQDPDQHPCQVSYDAGVKFAKQHPHADGWVISVKARQQEDPENFREGYFNTVNK